MNYRAPITDFIPKSTFVTRDIFEPHGKENKLSVMGYELSISFLDDVYFFGKIRSSLYTIENIYLSVIPITTGVDMKLNLKCSISANGEAYNTHYNDISPYNIPTYTANERKLLDIATAFVDASADDSFNLECDWGVYPVQVDLYMQGLIIEYSLV